MSISKGSIGVDGGFILDPANMSFTLTEDSESISGASGNKQQLLFGSFAGGSNGAVSEEMLMSIHQQLFPGASSVKNQLNFGSVIPENYSPINEDEQQLYLHERQNTHEREEIMIRLQDNQLDEDDGNGRTSIDQSNSYKGQQDGDQQANSPDKDKHLQGSNNKEKNNMNNINNNNNLSNNSNKSQFKTYKQYVVSKEVLQDEGMFVGNRKGKDKTNQSENIPSNSSNSFNIAGSNSSKSNRNIRNQMKYNNNSNNNNTNKAPPPLTGSSGYRSSGAATSAECLYQLGGCEMNTAGNQTGFLCGSSQSEVNRSETTRSCQTTNNHSSSHSNPITLQPSGSRELELLKKLEDQEDAFGALQKQLDLLKNEREKLIQRLNARELLLAAECQTTERDAYKQLSSTTARLEKCNEQLVRENKQLQQELIKHKTESFQKYEELKKSNDELLETYQEKFNCQMQIQEDAFAARISNHEKELVAEQQKRQIAEKTMSDQGLEVIRLEEQNRLLEENVKQLQYKNEQYSNVQKFLDAQQQLYLDSLSKSFLVQNGNSNINNQGIVRQPWLSKDNQIGEDTNNNMNMNAIWQNSDEFEWMKKISQQSQYSLGQQKQSLQQQQQQQKIPKDKEKSKSSEKWIGLDRKDKSKVTDKSRSKNSNDRSKGNILLPHSTSMQKKHKEINDQSIKDHSKEKNKSKNKLEVVLQVVQNNDRLNIQKNNNNEIKIIEQGINYIQEKDHEGEEDQEEQLVSQRNNKDEEGQQHNLGQSQSNYNNKQFNQDEDEDDSFMASPSQKEQQQQFQLELRQAKITQAAQQYSYSTQITKRNHYLQQNNNNNNNTTKDTNNIIHRHYPSSSSQANNSNSAPRERNHNINNTSRLPTHEDNSSDIIQQQQQQEEEHKQDQQSLSPRDIHSDRSFNNPIHDESISQLTQSLSRNNHNQPISNQKSFINKSVTPQQIAAQNIPINTTSNNNLNSSSSMFRHETIKGILQSREKATSNSAKQIRTKKPKKTDQHSFYNTIDDCSSSSFLGQQLQLQHKSAVINNADIKKKCLISNKQQNNLTDNLNNSQIQMQIKQQQYQPSSIIHPVISTTITSNTNTTNPSKFIFTQQQQQQQQQQSCSLSPQVQQSSQFLKQQLSPGPANSNNNKQLQQQQYQRSFLKLNNLQSAISNQSLLLSDISQDQSSVFSPRTPFTHRQAAVAQTHQQQRLDIVSDRSAVNHNNSSNKSQMKLRSANNNNNITSNPAHFVSLQPQSTMLSDREEHQNIKQKLKVSDTDSNRSTQLNQTSVLQKIQLHIQQQQLQEQSQQSQQQNKQIKQQGTSKQLQQLLQYTQQNKPYDLISEP